MNLELIAYKTQFGFWAFDHEHQDTIGEALLNGTEKVIDDYYFICTNQNAVHEDKIKFWLSTESFESSVTHLTLVSTDDDGSYYLDDLTKASVWLCPWLQGYFNEVPDKLYVYCEAVLPHNQEDEDFLDELLK